jgi:hypothetical protein
MQSMTPTAPGSAGGFPATLAKDFQHRRNPGKAGGYMPMIFGNNRQIRHFELTNPHSKAKSLNV